MLGCALCIQPCSFSALADIHPFAPEDQATGYVEIVKELERDLCEITGYDHVSFQPNRHAIAQCNKLDI